MRELAVITHDWHNYSINPIQNIRSINDSRDLVVQSTDLGSVPAETNLNYCWHQECRLYKNALSRKSYRHYERHLTDVINNNGNMSE